MPLAILQLPESYAPNLFDNDDSVLVKHLNKLVKEDGFQAVVDDLMWIKSTQETSLPYKTNAKEGTYAFPARNVYSFTTHAVKAESLDISRIFSETTSRIDRDIMLYKKIQQNCKNEQEILRKMGNLRMLEFKGEEKRFDPNMPEDYLFYWNFVKRFENKETLYTESETYEISYGTNDILAEQVNFGKNLYQKIVELAEEKTPENTWIVDFGVRDIEY